MTETPLQVEYNWSIISVSEDLDQRASPDSEELLDQLKHCFINRYFWPQCELLVHPSRFLPSPNVVFEIIDYQVMLQSYILQLLLVGPGQAILTEFRDSQPNKKGTSGCILFAFFQVSWDRLGYINGISRFSAKFPDINKKKLCL